MCVKFAILCVYDAPFNHYFLLLATIITKSIWKKYMIAYAFSLLKTFDVALLNLWCALCTNAQSTSYSVQTANDV